MILGYTRDALHCHCSVQRLGGKDTGPLHHENPSSSPTCPVASAYGCSPVSRKGLCTTISLGMGAGRAQSLSDTLNPSYSFPKRIPNQLQTGLWKALHPSRGKAWTTVLLKPCLCSISAFGQSQHGNSKEGWLHKYCSVNNTGPSLDYHR